MRLPFAALLLLGNAAAAAAPPEPATLRATDEAIPLAGHIAVLVDAAGAWSLEDVRARDAEFVIGAEETFSFGYGGQAYWYRVQLANPAGSAVADWVIEMQRPVLDYVDLHVTRADGATASWLTGDRRQAPPEQFAFRTFAFPVRIAPGETVTVHVRAQTAGAHVFRMTTWTVPGFQGHAVAQTFLLGGLVCALLAIALYNAVLGLRLRDAAYLYYVGWLLCIVYMALSFNGFARQYGNGLSDGAPALISNSAVYVLKAAGLLNLLFIREFLQTRLHAPRAHVLLTVLVAIDVALLALSPWLGFTLLDQINDVQTIVGIPIILSIAGYLAWKGLRVAWIYLIAWSLAFVNQVVLTLQIAGMLPSLIGGSQFNIGMLIGVVMLSMALADRIEAERREREKLSRLKRFFSPEVASAIVEDGESTLLAPKRREVTVLFADLRGFTAFSAESEPEEVIRVLREYREVIVALAAKHHGTLEHFSGDGVMVYFNAPVEIPEPEASAVRMAFELQQQLGTLCQAWRQRAHELGVGIGMASGFATVGAVGFKDRMDYSVVGSVTNLAARLCAQAQHGQILVSRKLLLKIEKLVAADHLGEHELKGLPKPVTVYNLTGLAPA